MTTAAKLGTTHSVSNNNTIPIPCTNTNTISTTPRLIDILNDRVEPDSVYSKINFLQFLVDKHCIENYEFHSELISIIENYDLFKKYKSTAEWFSLYNNFIESEIINLPANLVSNLSKKQLPELIQLKNIEKVIHNYLLASYYEFLTQLKTDDSSNPNTNSNVTSNTNSRSASFSTSVSSSFPSSANEQLTLLTVNKLNSKIRNSLLFNRTDETDFLKYMEFDDDHEEEEEDDGDYCNNHICPYDDDEVEINTGKDEKIFNPTANRSISASLSNSILKSRSPSPVEFNNNYSINSKIANNLHLNSNSTLDSNSVISNSSSSNSTVCGSCSCEKDYKKWARFTKKLKWRRKSSISTN